MHSCKDQRDGSTENGLIGERWTTDREQSLKDLAVRRERLTERLTRLTDAYLDGTIEKELFEERKAAILFDRQAIQGSTDAIERNERSIPQLVEAFLERAGTASSLFQTGSIAQKRRMVKTVSSNLSLSETNKEISSALQISENTVKFHIGMEEPGHMVSPWQD